MTETPRESVLSEAAGLITGDRNKTYGSPTENFENTAAIWNALLGHKLKAPITATEVGTLMVGLKLARTIAQPKRDNFVDMAGYAACAWECEEASSLIESGEGFPEVVSPASRYWIDSDGWYYRWADEELTYVDGPYRSRQRSDNSPHRYLDGDGYDDARELDVSEVPEWAR